MESTDQLCELFALFRQSTCTYLGCTICNRGSIAARMIVYYIHMPISWSVVDFWSTTHHQVIPWTGRCYLTNRKIGFSRMDGVIEVVGGEYSMLLTGLLELKQAPPSNTLRIGPCWILHTHGCNWWYLSSRVISRLWWMPMVNCVLRHLRIQWSCIKTINGVMPWLMRAIRRIRNRADIGVSLVHSGFFVRHCELMLHRLLPFASFMYGWQYDVCNICMILWLSLCTYVSFLVRSFSHSYWLVPPWTAPPCYAHLLTLNINFVCLIISGCKTQLRL